MSTEDLLFYIDGLLGQIAVSRQLAEAQKVSTVPFDSVFAATMSLRALVEHDAEPETPDDGSCKHPQGSVAKQPVGGGGYILMCRACNEIVEQQSGVTG